MPVKSRHSRSFFIFPKVASTMVMTRYLCSLFPNMSTARSVTEIGLFARCAKPFRFTARSNVICLACLSTLNQQCRKPKQQIRKLAHRLYTLAC